MFIMQLGVLLVMKTLQDDWYIVIKACKFMVVKILFLYCMSVQPYMHV